MSRPKLTVDVDGAEHRVTVETDARSGRTSIRLNGKMISRPLTATEEEREFPIAGRVHILRRMQDGTFDLDVAPEDPALLAAAAYASDSTAVNGRKPP